MTVRNFLFYLPLLFTGCDIGGGFGTRHASPAEFIDGSTNKLPLAMIYTSGRPKTADVVAVCKFRYVNSIEWHQAPFRVVQINTREMQLTAEIVLPLSDSIPTADSIEYYILGTIKGHQFDWFSKQAPCRVPISRKEKLQE